MKETWKKFSQIWQSKKLHGLPQKNCEAESLPNYQSKKKNLPTQWSDWIIFLFKKQMIKSLVF